MTKEKLLLWINDNIICDENCFGIQDNLCKISVSNLIEFINKEWDKNDK